MTNEQLKILLENQAELLRIAIEKAAELMPEGAEMKTTNIVTWDHPGFKTVDTERPLALGPLYKHLGSIERQVAELNHVYWTTGIDQSGGHHV